MPAVNIDGARLDFQPGESIIQVATRAGIDIPYYCWHPKLSIAANCRMCLVEVEKSPKLVPACQTPCADGMVVKTGTDRVKETQRAIHELLLVNHPIDCPICDQAGECKLQDYYMKFQLAQSPMKDGKAHKPRLDQLGARVIYNGERCVMCTRCVRFMDEIAKERQLGIFERGDHVRIGTFPNKPLDNPYSLNVVDVCPVGALTSAVFRFKQRVWYLSRSASVCPGCAAGCNVNVDQRSGVVYRLLPRANEAVNQCWLCDEGRLTYSRANDARLSEALVRKPGGDAPEVVTARDAMTRAAALLKPVADSRQGLAAAISLHATCEEAYVFGRFVKELLGVTEVTLLAHPDGAADKLLRVADKNPNRAGVTRVMCDLGLDVSDRRALETRLNQGAVKALIIVGHESDDLTGLAAAMRRLEIVVHLAHARTAIADAAHVTFPTVAWVQVDGTWVNGYGRLQRLVPAFPPEAAARPTHEWLGELASHLGVTFALPSVATVRAEMERSLKSFQQSKLTNVGPLGQVCPT
jgi:NADH-quinone oxidoreductase subunit G